MKKLRMGKYKFVKKTWLRNRLQKSKLMFKERRLDMYNFALAQIFGVIGIIFSVLSMQMKTKKI